VIRKGFVKEIKPLMDILIEDSTFWISPPLYNKILELAGEKEDE
jgi:predicted nucleic acid-binding protein